MELVQGDSAAKSSSSFAVLKVGEGVLGFVLLLGVLGNKRFALDPVLKDNLGFLLVEGVWGDFHRGCYWCLRRNRVAFLFILF